MICLLQELSHEKICILNKWIEKSGHGVVKTVHHLVACMHRDAHPLVSLVLRQVCGLHIDTARFAAGQFNYLWIHYPAPQKWHIGQQEHTKIAAG